MVGVDGRMRDLGSLQYRCVRKRRRKQEKLGKSKLFSNILETVLVDVPTSCSVGLLNDLSHSCRRGRRDLVGGNSEITPEARRLVHRLRGHFWSWL